MRDVGQDRRKGSLRTAVTLEEITSHSPDVPRRLKEHGKFRPKLPPQQKDAA